MSAGIFFDNETFQETSLLEWMTWRVIYCFISNET